jgi:hypothetical protein
MYFLVQHYCSNSRKNVVSIVVSDVVNLVASENKFKTLVEYVEYKLFEQNIKNPIVGVWKKD